jgi:hypothetical protein
LSCAGVAAEFFVIRTSGPFSAAARELSGAAQRKARPDAVQLNGAPKNDLDLRERKPSPEQASVFPIGGLVQTGLVPDGAFVYAGAAAIISIMKRNPLCGYCRHQRGSYG